MTAERAGTPMSQESSHGAGQETGQVAGHEVGQVP